MQVNYLLGNARAAADVPGYAAAKYNAAVPRAR